MILKLFYYKKSQITLKQYALNHLIFGALLIY